MFVNAPTIQDKFLGKGIVFFILKKEELLAKQAKKLKPIVWSKKLQGKLSKHKYYSLLKLKAQPPVCTACEVLTTYEFVFSFNWRVNSFDVDLKLVLYLLRYFELWK